MRKPQKLLGVLLVLMGALLAIGYSYLVLFAGANTAFKVLRVTAGVLAILVGAFIGAVGLLLVFGWKEHSITEDTSEE